MDTGSHKDKEVTCYSIVSVLYVLVFNVCGNLSIRTCSMYVHTYTLEQALTVNTSHVRTINK